MESPDPIIEHIVLFNVTEEEDVGCDPSRVHDMVNTLNSLPDSNSDLIYLTAGPILRTRSCPSSSNDTTDEEDPKLSHMVHARFHSQADVTTFTTLIEELVNPLCDVVLSLSWTAVDLQAPLAPNPGSALRLTLYNLNPTAHDHDEDDVSHDDHVGSTIGLLLQGLSKINNKWKSHSDNSPFQLEQFSYGQTNNISVTSSSMMEESSLGYNVKVAALAVFHDLNELDACEEYEDEMRSLMHNHKIQPCIHNLIHLDYVLPRLTLSSPPPIP